MDVTKPSVFVSVSVHLQLIKDTINLETMLETSSTSSQTEEIQCSLKKFKELVCSSSQEESEMIEYA